MTVTDLVDQAIALDLADPLAHFRDQFIGSADPKIIAYLDGNSLGRPLRATRDRIRHFVDQVWGSRLIRAWDEGWMDDPVRIGDDLGRVALGAASGQTVVGDSTSVMLYKWIRAAVASPPERPARPTARAASARPPTCRTQATTATIQPTRNHLEVKRPIALRSGWRTWIGGASTAPRCLSRKARLVATAEASASISPKITTSA